MRSLVELVSARLAEDAGRLRQQFAERGSCGTRHCTLDDVLPHEVAMEVAAGFPTGDTMRLLKSFRETKYTTKSFAHASPIVKEALFAYQAPSVVRLVEDITGLRDQHPDPQLYAGGLSLMEQGHFLHPHIDNSHDGSRRRYRTLNLLYYVTPGWGVEDGEPAGHHGNAPALVARRRRGARRAWPEVRVQLLLLGAVSGRLVVLPRHQLQRAARPALAARSRGR